MSFSTTNIKLTVGHYRDSRKLCVVYILLQKLRNWYRLIVLISHVDLVKDCVDDIIEIASYDKNAKVRLVVKVLNSTHIIY